MRMEVALLVGTSYWRADGKEMDLYARWKDQAVEEEPFRAAPWRYHHALGWASSAEMVPQLAESTRKTPGKERAEARRGRALAVRSSSRGAVVLVGTAYATREAIRQLTRKPLTNEEMNLSACGTS